MKLENIVKIAAGGLFGIVLGAGIPFICSKGCKEKRTFYDGRGWVTIAKDQVTPEMFGYILHSKRVDSFAESKLVILGETHAKQSNLRMRLFNAAIDDDDTILYENDEKGRDLSCLIDETIPPLHVEEHTKIMGSEFDSNAKLILRPELYGVKEAKKHPKVLGADSPELSKKFLETWAEYVELVKNNQLRRAKEVADKLMAIHHEREELMMSSIREALQTTKGKVYILCGSLHVKGGSIDSYLYLGHGLAGKASQEKIPYSAYILPDAEEETEPELKSRAAIYVYFANGKFFSEFKGIDLNTAFENASNYTQFRYNGARVEHMKFEKSRAKLKTDKGEEWVEDTRALQTETGQDLLPGDVYWYDGKKREVIEVEKCYSYTMNKEQQGVVQRKIEAFHKFIELYDKHKKRFD